MRALLSTLACLLSFPAVASTIILQSDLVDTGTKVIELASGDTLDLNGFTVRCAPGDPSTAMTFGVFALSTNAVTIKNGAITGCMFGVHAGNSAGLVIENVDFSGNTYIGINLADARGAVVRGSTFGAITGYTPEAYAIGINGVGSMALIIGNVFFF